jgi:ABC-type glycerol-3-phosphate transport system substrate-binding protein
MEETGFWFMGDIYSSPPEFKKYNVASYPVGPGGTKAVSGYWPSWLVIPKGSAHPQEAFQWLDYLGSTGMELWNSITPILPTNKTISYLQPAVTVQHMGMAFAQDATRFFHHQLDIAIPMWNSPIQGFANDQILKAIDRIMHKVAKPKDALGEAQRACQNQLQKVLASQ